MATLELSRESHRQCWLTCRRHFALNEVVNRLPGLNDSSRQVSDWLYRNREAINDRLDVSFAQAERCESYSPEEALKMLSERRLARASLA
ncbi:hypothetical protein GOB94_06445 [Granulicella sp. 5B5]|uniref:hypothetical protein n=1 Tax=Granulicella sp. 5B5 TaxID=1617967 RepID=UPI0015F7631C|nr:hypothetical protein [Granulicella sp. 5B5]QMV18363.1 hypothetical protein GOB94_06445 [Granulicella sp. 5B5]